jgi:hypothetical protein
VPLSEAGPDDPASEEAPVREHVGSPVAGTERL